MNEYMNERGVEERSTGERGVEEERGTQMRARMNGTNV